MSDKGNQAILSILREARDVDMSLTRTALVKFVYLLDVLSAEESEGRTWTEWKWKFHHFGPWTAQALQSIDYLASQSLIEAEEGTSRRGDNDYCLYTLPTWKTVSSLEQLGVSPDVRLRLVQHIKNFATNIPDLLNFVYFKTEPMMDAVPGQVLDFSNCTKLKFTSIKPIVMKPIERKSIEVFRQKLTASISAKMARSHKITWEGPFDEAYFGGLAEISDDHLPIGITGKAAINI